MLQYQKSANSLRASLAAFFASSTRVWCSNLADRWSGGVSSPEEATVEMSVSGCRDVSVSLAAVLVSRASRKTEPPTLSGCAGGGGSACRAFLRSRRSRWVVIFSLVQIVCRSGL